jgi:4-diphosphocytidyl-2-C-methyl-D-erythritol kinase
VTRGKNARRFAPAKVNLFLHVGDKRPNGYHDLLSLVVFAEIGDVLEVREAKRTALTVTGPFAAKLQSVADNLALSAAAKLEAWARQHGHDAPAVELTLEKNLPVSSGIGGGSSDAAAALHLLAAHWGLPIGVDELEAIALALGADVPVCLRGAPTLVTGLGEVLTAVEDLPPLALVLVNPLVEVATAQVFKALVVRTGIVVPPKLFPLPATARELAMILDHLANDLAAPAKAIAPVIMRVESALVATDGCFIARMSGSGATCFGIYETMAAAEIAAGVIAKAHPEWWVRAGTTNMSP